MLAAALIYFNSLENLKRSVPSYIDNVKYVFAVDGKFMDFPGDVELSNDGSTEYLQQFPNVILSQVIGKEWDKRNKYLEMCKEYGVDELLIIDSDEWVQIADWPEFYNNIKKTRELYPKMNFFGINFIWRLKPSEVTPYPRLWVRPYEKEYFNAHCVFRDRGGGMMNKSGNAASIVIDGITCNGNDKLWSDNYLKSSTAYQTIMIQEEKPYRIMGRG